MFKLISTSLLAIFIVFSSCQSKSQEKKQNEIIDTKAITWEADLTAALAKAKETGKPLFVECFSPTCPICMSLEPFFKNPEVAKLYNTNFVNFKLDVGNAELVKFLNERNIFLPSFPMVFFFDGDGNIIHQSELVANMESFKSVANAVNDDTKNSKNFKSRFEKGERNLDFLVNYASFAAITRDTMANLKAAEELFKIYPKEKIGSEESWKITKKCVYDIDNGFAKYWFDNKVKAAAIEHKEGHDKNEDNILGRIIQYSLYSPRGRNYSSQQINTIKNLMAKSGAAQYSDGVTWEFEIRALTREGKAPAAIPVGSKMAIKYGSSGQSLVYITKVFNDLYPDKAYVPTAKSWLAKAKPLLNASQTKELAEYYFESARMLQKAGETAAAKKEAELATSMAVKSQLDLVRFSELSASIK